jgi:hypothetical protein
MQRRFWLLGSWLPYRAAFGGISGTQPLPD